LPTLVTRYLPSVIAMGVPLVSVIVMGDPWTDAVMTIVPLLESSSNSLILLVLDKEIAWLRLMSIELGGTAGAQADNQAKAKIKVTTVITVFIFTENLTYLTHITSRNMNDLNTLYTIKQLNLDNTWGYLKVKENHAPG
jgi:hypothetical protein